ncbi:OmpA family protein [Muriicola marianensis]|uniref:Membrane protein n=1 Tax=Muriicola marianensis TaxID=1324801 RepID=A0ABQ1QPA6_9FLAO|nr:OmpA family protein [Muriicola marianensis]GGD39345.1 membrane protein [Muriicola marianensis]
MIKRTELIVMVLSLVLGCNTVKNANNTQKGAVIGATGGAVIGGVIGNNVGKGNTVLGAIIGGVVGGAAGGYIGNRMDRQAERIQEEIPGAEVTRVGEGINVTFSQGAGVYFDTNKSDIKGTSVETLNKLAGIFKEYPKTVILVEGHTDSAGSDEYNMGLSKLRAESVTNYLISQGIDASRFTTKWYGEAQPIADNATAEGKAKNRRVELGIIASEELKQEAMQKTKG